MPLPSVYQQGPVTTSVPLIVFDDVFLFVRAGQTYRVLNTGSQSIAIYANTHSGTALATVAGGALQRLN